MRINSWRDDCYRYTWIIPHLLRVYLSANYLQHLDDFIDHASNTFVNFMWLSRVHVRNTGYQLVVGIHNGSRPGLLNMRHRDGIELNHRRAVRLLEC
jgi:hypothetical protein